MSRGTLWFCDLQGVSKALGETPSMAPFQRKCRAVDRYPRPETTPKQMGRKHLKHAQALPAMFVFWLHSFLASFTGV